MQSSAWDKTLTIAAIIFGIMAPILMLVLLWSLLD
jgi:hypothetical protein